jgi:large repetitive protein
MVPRPPGGAGSTETASATQAGAAHAAAAGRAAAQTGESFGETGATFAQTGDVNVNRTTATFLSMGTKNSGTTLARPYLQFGNVGLNLAGDTLSAASLQVWVAFAGNCTAAQTFNAYPVNEAWTLTSVSFPGPTAGANMGQFSGTEKAAECSNTVSGGSPTIGQTDSDSLTLAPVQAWLNGTSTNNGIEMRAGAETSNASFKLLDGTNSPHPPVLALTFTGGAAPQINSVFPPNNYNASSLTPELQASATDPDNGPDPVTYQFEVLNSSGTVVACSTPGGCSQAPGTGWISKPDWTVPSGKLTWGQAYAWEVQAWDGAHVGPGPTEFLTTQVPQPALGTATQNAGAQGISPGSSAYTTSVTDAQVATVGPALSVERDYDSAYAFPGGAFGTGWSSLLDMKVAPGLTDAAGHVDTVNVTYPDGEQVGFGQNSNGSFTAPQGRYATLAAVTGGGYTLTDKNDTTYTFAQALGGSAFGISSIADALGNTEHFTWNTASPPQITGITSASGRTLTIGWSTPSGSTAPHVATVTTSDVTPGSDSSALTWSYGYSGDSLALACSPAAGSSCAGASACPGTTGCTAYTYMAGTEYPQTVLDTGPHSYWRLDESAGTAAASSVLANEATDNGTYTGITLGQPGPLAGSTATAAGFTGLSVVSLPMTQLDSASYQSVALWFKTTTSGGVLFGSARDPVVSDGTTSGPYTPTLYIGTDGALRGEFAQGSQTPVSAGPVADGHWHMAVLTSAGSTQSLYLDGHLAGTLPGPSTTPGSTWIPLAPGSSAARGHPSRPPTPGSPAPATSSPVPSPTPRPGTGR